VDHEVDRSPSAAAGALAEFSAVPADDVGCHEVTAETAMGVDGVERAA